VMNKKILRRLGITPERRRQAVRERKTGEMKTLRVLWQTLADLLGKWLRPEAASKEQIVDQILMEQFINDLDDNTQNWVRCHCPTSSREALQWAEQFDAAQGNQRRNKGVKGTDSTAQRVIVSKGNRQESLPGPTCFACGKRGHFAQNCPQEVQVGPPKDRDPQDNRPTVGDLPEVESMDCGVGCHNQDDI
uniref:CCHC-type domain-containing protein n=1 Tax=Crocodylus porosus TaxID=8502 RepID=A0A7M4EXX1_CROPO